MMMTMTLYHILVYSVRFSLCVNLSVSAHVLLSGSSGSSILYEVAGCHLTETFDSTNIAACTPSLGILRASHHTHHRSTPFIRYQSRAPLRLILNFLPGFRIQKGLRRCREIYLDAHLLFLSFPVLKLSRWCRAADSECGNCVFRTLVL